MLLLLLFSPERDDDDDERLEMTVNKITDNDCDY
jgi:hypothetical protein